jgi:Ribbon-helix-helix protein, copG family
MTGPGRPAIGPAHKVRVQDELWDLLADEARAEGVGLAEMMRRILAERYEEGT